MKKEMNARISKISKSNDKAKSAESSSLVKQLTDKRPDTRLSAIISKMNSGADLSPAEWSYLHDNYPEIYEKAMRQAAEKKAYEEQLKSCKTKEEARMVHMNQLGSIKSELEAGKPIEEVTTKMNMVTNVYNNFVVSEQYSKMAENEAEIERNKSEEEKDIAELEKPREDEPIEEEAVEEEPVEESTIKHQNGTNENVQFMPDIDIPESETNKVTAEDATISTGSEVAVASSTRSEAEVTANAYKPISTSRKIVDFHV
jgi:hypothetical protein